jgi:hypothetical protein
VSLVRMQILLEEDERRAVEEEARRLGISMSEVIRRQVRPLALAEEPAGYDGEWPPKGDPFFALIGFVEGEGANDISIHHDTYLYGGEIT